MISMTDFAVLTRDIYDFFGKNSPKNSRISIWHDIIAKHREPDIRAAFEWMEKNLDNIPNNLPKTISNAIYELSKSDTNQENQAFKPHRHGFCEDCNGTGIFKMRVCSSKGTWSEPIQYCSKCDNYKSWTGSPGQRISRLEIEAMNIPFVPYNRVFSAEVYV